MMPTCSLLTYALAGVAFAGAIVFVILAVVFAWAVFK